MPVLGPILAQVAMLALSERTEARYVISDDTHAEASARPAANLNLGWRHFALSFGYAPNFTLRPLESSPREVLVYNVGYLGATYTSGHTSIQVTESGAYGDQVFAVAALGDPRAGSAAPIGTGNPGTGSPGTGTGNTGTGNTGTGNTGTGNTGTGNTGTGNTGTGNTGIGNGGAGMGGTGTPATGAQATTNDPAHVVRFATESTTVGVTHQPTAVVWLHGELSYAVSGATRAIDKTNYPLTKTPRALASVRDRVTPTDDLTGLVSAQYGVSSGGNSAWLGAAGGTWGHQLTRMTGTLLGVGIAWSRAPVANGFVEYTIFPTFLAGLNTRASLGRGVVSASTTASSSPVLDLVTAAVDPRIGLSALLGWRLDRFSASLTGATTLSLQSQANAGSMQAVTGTAGIGYQFGTVVSMDAGVRAAYQKFQGQTTVPFAYAAFVGVNFAFGKQL